MKNCVNSYLTPSPMECRIHKDSPVIPTLNQIIPIPRSDTYFLKINSNIALPSTPRSLFCRTC